MFCSVSSGMVGGAVLEDGDGTDLAQVYNPKTSMWTEAAPMQIARSGSAACTLKGKIYVIGIIPCNAQLLQLCHVVIHNAHQSTIPIAALLE